MWLDLQYLIVFLVSLLHFSTMSGVDASQVIKWHG